METFLTLAKCIKRIKLIELKLTSKNNLQGVLQNNNRNSKHDEGSATAMDNDWDRCEHWSECPPSRHPSLPPGLGPCWRVAVVTMLAGPRPNLIVYRGWRRNLIIPSRPLDNTVTVIMHHSAPRTKHRTPAAGDMAMRNIFRLRVPFKTLW